MFPTHVDPRFQSAKLFSESNVSFDKVNVARPKARKKTIILDPTKEGCEDETLVPLQTKRKIT